MSEEAFPFHKELIWIGFFASVWIGEKVFLRCKTSPIVGSILVGVILGPALADIVPFPEALSLLGKLGVLLLVLESGLAVDLKTLKSYGLRAFLAALVGVIATAGLAFLVAFFCFDADAKV